MLCLFCSDWHSCPWSAPVFLPRTGLSPFSQGAFMDCLQAVAAGRGTRIGPQCRREVGIAADTDLHTVCGTNRLAQEILQIIRG